MSVRLTPVEKVARHAVIRKKLGYDPRFTVEDKNEVTLCITLKARSIDRLVQLIDDTITGAELIGDDADEGASVSAR
jgi:hypothetical protein